MPDAVLRHRGALVALNGVTAVAAAAGAVQLVAGVATPPDSDLPWPLTGWTLPGLWLLLTVALPTGAAAWLAWRRSPGAPVAALLAACALAVELLVQLPFLGLSVLQAVMGAVAVAIGALATDAIRDRETRGRAPAAE